MKVNSGEPVRIVTDNYRKPPTNYNDTATWGIGGIDVYDRNNVRKFKIRNTTKKRPSIYVMLDPWVLADRNEGDAYAQTALERLQNTIYHTNYTPSETECNGDLCVEVGDRLDVRFNQRGAYDTRNKFRSYVLERHFKGIQSFRDTYTSKGNLKQPIYQIANANWHVGDSQNSATSGQGTGGVSVLSDEHDRRVIALLRNYGEPMLDEPVVDLVYNKEDGQVEIKWTDPQDITSYSPLPIEWAGTEVVRKEGSAPLHGWSSVDSEYGGTVLVTSTTRDEYSETAYVDDTIEPNKRYYYAIRPYFIKLDDADHPIKQYRWTKIYSVDTQRILVAPTITTVQVDGTSVTALYLIPALEVGSYTSIKLAAKKNNIPASISDADKVMDIPEPTTLIPIGSATMTGLDAESHYYFVIFVEDDSGMTASSEVVDCMTGESPVPSDLQQYVDKMASVVWGPNDSNTLLGYLDTTGNSNYWELDDIYSYAVSGNFNNNGNQYYFYVLSDCTIEVTTGEDTVSVSYDYTVAPYNVIHTWGRGTFGPYDHSGNSGNYIETRGNSTGINFYSPYNVDDMGFTLTTSFSSIADCFVYLAQHFRRIRSLYVNDVAWIDSGDTTSKTLYQLAKTHDLTNIQINNIGGSNLTDHTVDSLSSYFGTTNILVAERDNGNHVNAYDGNNASGRFTVSMTEAMSYIPITRCKVKSFSFKGKLTPYGTQWDNFYVQTGFINGSTIKINATSANWNGSSDWSDYSLTYETPVMADYVVIGGNDGQWEIKDFVAEVVTYEE